MNGSPTFFQRLFGLVDKTTSDQKLLSAAMLGMAEKARQALTEGANPEAVDTGISQGRTALEFAAQEGHAEIVALLLDAGAKPRHVDVAACCRGGHIGALLEILKRARPDAWAPGGEATEALDWAACLEWAAGLRTILPLAPHDALRRWVERRASRQGRARVLSFHDFGDSEPPLRYEEAEQWVRAEMAKREANEIAAGMSTEAASDAKAPPRRI